VGFKLLQKMGWSTTKGLGKNENGILEPLEIQYNKSTHGLGVLKKEKKITNLVHHCEICNTNVSDSAWQAHVNGKKHRKNQESRTNIHCKICDITLDVNAWASHIAGKKHAKRSHLQEQQTETTVKISAFPREQSMPVPQSYFPPFMVNESPQVNYLHPSLIRMLQGNPN
jgi:ribosomal protein L37AE/L43A